MSIATKRTCPVCKTKFDPTCEWQVCDTRSCANVLRVRRFRQRKRFGGDDGGPGGGQRMLFPKTAVAKAKHAKAAPVPEPTLFEAEMHATFGGAIEFYGDAETGEETGLRPIRGTTGIMLTRKPVRSVQAPQTASKAPAKASAKASGAAA